MSLRALQGPTGGGAPVGGSGTTNTIPRWTGASTLGDSVITQSGSNIGIGTASPGAILHTLGTGTTTGIFATSSANSWIELRRSTSTTLGYIGTGSLVTGGAAADLAFRCESGNLLFSTVATERARIDSTGNVAIGTATPATANSRLTVAGGFIVPAGGFGVYQVGDHLNLQAASTKNVHLRPNDGVLAVNVGATSCDMSAVFGYGLKLPATPGNPDTQTLDAYQEIGTGTPAEIALTLTCGTSGTITVNAASSKARVTRVGNKVIGHGRIVVSSVSAPLGRLSCTLTGCPQPFTFFVCETRTNDTTGVPSGNIIVGTSDTSATPIVYFDRYSPNTRNDDAAANIQAGTTIVFSFSYSV